MDGFKSLKAGQKVEFELGKDGRGNVAEKVVVIE
jgi:cold shock CspA family protein